MPIEKAPQNPLPQNYVPKGGMPYKVKTNDDWGSVAKAHGISAKDLILFNFGTTNEAEINWYLRRNVGCQKATYDKKNWLFTSDAHPGVIYIPPKKDAATATEPSNIWFGIGVQGGGHAVLVGKDTVEAWLVSYDNYSDSFFMNVDGWRLGPGLGGSVGVVLVVVTSLRQPSHLQGHMVGDWDFQANLGGKWGDLAKGAEKLREASKLARAGKKITKGAIKLGEWEKTRDAIKAGITAAGINLNAAEPQVVVISIPGAGTGAELSAYFGVGTIQVHGVSVEGPAKAAQP